MKLTKIRFYFHVVMVIFIILLAGCTKKLTGSKKIKTKEFPYADFIGVEIGPFSFEIEIQQANKYQVVITTNENVFEHLEHTVDDNVLRIALKNADGNYHLTNVQLKVKILMPDLKHLTLNHSKGKLLGSMHVQKIAIKLDRGSQLSGNLIADIAELDISGLSSVTLQGSCDALTLVSDKGSNVDLGHFLAQDAQIDVDGHSEVTLHVKNTLKGTLKSGSELYYYGNPKMNIEKIKRSTILKKEILP